jgi:hypothetical protein
MTWLLPLQAMAAGQSESSLANRNVAAISDIELSSGGRITGQFVDAQGQPKANQVVIAQRQHGQPQQSRTDSDGRFVIDGASGGLYQIATADSIVLCRCWAEKTAPPGANRDLLIVSGDGVTRGQRPIGELLFSAPVLVALVIAAAIAIPIAIHNSQDAS